MSSYRIFILGDPHISPREPDLYREVIEDINRLQPDMVLVLGDLTGGPVTGTTEGTRKAVDLLNQLQAPWHSIIGNHDLQGKEFETDADSVGMLTTALGRSTPWFRTEAGPLTVFGLSSTRWRVNPVNKHEIVLEPDQLAWWKSELETLGDRPALVLCHAPPIGSGLMVMPELHARVGNAYVNQNHNPNEITQLIWEHPNILFWFSGHNHLGQHYRDALSRRLGVWFAHTGTPSGGQARDGHRHSRILDVKEDCFTLTTFDFGLRKADPEPDLTVAGSLVDQVALRKRWAGRRFIAPDPDTMRHGEGESARPPSTTRFLFLSDAHVVDKISPVQRRILQWCRRRIKTLDPDLVLLGGDLTHHANPAQASSFLNALTASDVPMTYLVGNNEGEKFDLEEPFAETIPVVRRCEAYAGDGVKNVYFLETPNAERAAEAVRELLNLAAADQSCLVLAHFPPEQAGEELMGQLSGRPAPMYWICGHRHAGRSYEKGSLRVTICGGLDPVKVRGQRPELLQIDWDGVQPVVTAFQPSNHILYSPTPRRFPLGLAYRGDAIDLLETALEHGVPGVQFHYKFTHGQPSKKELEAVARHRGEFSNSFLSMHLPNFPDPEQGIQVESMQDWLQWARTANIDDLTVHLPKMPVAAMFTEDQQVADTEWARQCRQAYCELARLTLEMGAQLSLENHYNKTRPPERDELLSCRPWHLTRFIDMIREDLVGAGIDPATARKVGMIFDSGHAFRDAKIAKIHGLADWVEQTAPYLQLAHIHQVVPIPELKRTKNHLAISDIRGPQINYEGLLNVINEAVDKPFTLLIEVRDRDGALESLRSLTDFFDAYK